MDKSLWPSVMIPPIDCDHISHPYVSTEHISHNGRCLRVLQTKNRQRAQSKLAVSWSPRTTGWFKRPSVPLFCYSVCTLWFLENEPLPELGLASRSVNLPVRAPKEPRLSCFLLEADVWFAYSLATEILYLGWWHFGETTGVEEIAVDAIC